MEHIKALMKISDKLLLQPHYITKKLYVCSKEHEAENVKLENNFDEVCSVNSIDEPLAKESESYSIEFDVGFIEQLTFEVESLIAERDKLNMLLSEVKNNVGY